MRVRVLSLALAAMCCTSMVNAQDGAQDGPPSQQTSAPSDQAKIAAVQRHVDAYRSGSLDRFVATFTPDAEVYANGMVAVGHAQIRALYAANFAPGAPSITIENSGLSNGQVFLSVGYVFDNGEQMCCSYTEYEVVGGKISYLESSS
mgnify:CR=1 FL=1